MTEKAIPAAPLDLVPLALKTVSNQKISMAICIAGRIDAGQMQQALGLLIIHHSILGYQLLTAQGWPTWHQATDIDKQLQVTVVDSNDDLQTAAAFCECSQDVLATISVRIFRGPINDTLYVTVDHTVTDVAGAKEIIYTLASYYAQLGREIAPRPISRPPPRRDLKEVRDQIGTFDKFRAILDWRVTRGHWLFPGGGIDHPVKPACIIRRLGAESIPVLKQYCRPYGATINDLLIAALFSSMHDLHSCNPGTTLPVQFTIDLRRNLWPGRHKQVANLSSSSHVWLQKSPEENFTQTLRTTHLALADIKRNNPGLGAAMVLELIFKLGFQRTELALQNIFKSSLVTGMGNPLLINTGLIDETRLNFGSVEVINACLIGPSLLVPGLTVTASGFRNQLTLSAGFSSTVTKPDYMASALEGMVRFLPAPCEP